KGIGAAAGEAVKFLFKKGDTPANPLFVADVGGGLGGGGGVPGGTGGGLASKLLMGGAAVAGGVIIGKEIAQAINDQVITPAKTSEQSAFTKAAGSNDITSLQKSLDAINSQLESSDTGTQVALIASRIPYIGDALGNVAPELEKQRDQLKRKLDELKREQAHTSSVTAHSASEHNAVIRKSMIDNSNRITRQIISHAASERADAQRGRAIDRQTASHTAQAVERIRGVEAESRNTSANTAAIRRKNFSPTVDVNVHNAFSISNIINAQKTYSYVTATGRVGGKII
ncbi:MAG TPA: hypothetical protein VFK56_19550, partial [Mycobacterium sp.]|nr:hypothetical protein [Mycobacterium sp.]